MDVLIPAAIVGLWVAIYISGEVQAARRAPEIKKQRDEEWLAKVHEWNRVDPS